ncbi:MAG: DUF1365 domain-containing protein [Kiloniellaceae bacterium]
MSTAAPTASALYFGKVMHKRLRPFVHGFTYRVFSLYLDLDELAACDRRLRLFSHNRWNLFSFHDRDHGARDGGALKPWIEAQLAAAGIDLAGGPVRLLCFPRVLGYVFSPLSIWFCHHADGSLRAILYEVRNTFGGKHGYLIPVAPGHRDGDAIVQSAAKRFYVSPFIAMDSRYDFRLAVPGERLAVAIHQWVPEGGQLLARQSGRRRTLSDGNLLRAFFAYPLMTAKVIGAIHWQALRLWLKGARTLPRPPAPAQSVTLVAAPDAVPGHSAIHSAAE